jgi:two-component system sensor histidine kinase UhpB
MADETETHLYRIAQEALTNIARHSGAQHVQMRLESSGGQVSLTIQDDGRGLPDPARPGPRGLGMIGMRARARSAGGDLQVRSRPRQGVLIEVRVPIRDETHSFSVS